MGWAKTIGVIVIVAMTGSAWAQPFEVEALLAGVEPGQLQKFLDELRQARDVLHQQRRRRTGRRRQRVELLAQHPGR